MLNRLATLLVPLVFLGLGYFVFTKFRFDEKQPVEPFTISDIDDPTVVDPSDTDPEGMGEEEAPIEIAVGVLPDVHVAEYPGRRVLVSGRMSTADGRAQVLEAIQSDLGESFVVDDQIKLDYQCEPFTWGSKVGALDFQEIQKVHRFSLRLMNDSITLSGEVFSDSARDRVVDSVGTTLPSGITLVDELLTTEKPKASFSVWAAPDRTFLVSGTVPEGQSNSYVQLIESAMPGMPVINDMIEDRFLEKPPWQEQVQAFLPGFLRSTQRAALKIDGENRVKIEGLAQSKTMSTMRKRLEASFPTPKYNLEIDLQLGVPTDIKVATPDPSKAAEAAQVARTVREMIGTTKVYFRSGRSRVSQLTSAERAKLDRLGRQWRKENFNSKVYVFGFTDSSGDPGTNAYFSKTRCENVVAYLRKTYNIDSSFFEVIGTPPNHPKESGSANELRRVEFSLTNQPSQPPVVNWAATSTGPINVLKPVVTSDLFSKTQEVLFGSGKISPSKEDRDALFQLGSALALEKSQDMIIVYGYSDSKGKAAANRWYTEERCKSVKKELVRGGVKSDRIIMRPILPAKVADNVEKKDKEEGEEEVNPRRVKLVMMSREAYEKEEAAKKAAEDAPEEEEASEGEAESAPKEDEGSTAKSEPTGAGMIEPGTAFRSDS